MSTAQCHLGALHSRNFNGFVSTSGATENLDLAPRNAKMVCQQVDDCLVGPAFPGRLLDLDYEAIAFLTDSLGPGVGLNLNLDFHSLSLPIFPDYEVAGV